ncbi:uncharacterized protein LOC134190860 [Corticium candelabrum]|uniref:uncharacterized protein LOC134190860 n=1 Tax=Corticium candelabrum TaxID=121492 RepID=UPI002E25E15A|nr:uncharacterized protein LOC134190860 [Corticium candelabrum]
MSCRIWILSLFCVSFLCRSLQTQPDLPGHLRPLGFHRPPLSHVDEFDYVISPREFWEKYASKGEPVVFRGAANHSAGFSRWTNEYLVENYGDLELKLEAKKEKGGDLPIGDAGMARDTLRHFISRYERDDAYVVSQLPQPMYHEVSALPCLMCGSFRKRLLEVNYWMSSGGTKSILHRDADNAINCLFAGRKDWILIDRQYTHLVPLTSGQTGSFSAFALLDIEKINLKKYPDFANVPWRYANLTAGDCLFLPYSYLHQVTSYERNIAVSLLFARFTEFEEDENCSEDKLVFTPLSDLHITWSYPGHGEMSMGNLDPEHVRQGMLSAAGDDEVLTREDISSMLIIHKGSSREEAEAVTERLFTFLGPDIHGTIPQSDIDGYSEDTLKEIATMLDGDDANTEEYEEYLLDVGYVQDSVVKMVNSSSELDVDDFVMKWVNDVGGSMPIGRRLFHDLDVDGDGVLNDTDLSKAGDEPFTPFLKSKRSNKGNELYLKELEEVSNLAAVEEKAEENQDHDEL